MIIEKKVILNFEGKKTKTKKRKDYITSFSFILNLIKIIIISILYLLFYSLSIINFHRNLNPIKNFKNDNNSFHGRIFVSFMYNNEAEMAFIHLWRLYDYVDKFIILISNKTHSNIPKNFSFMSYEENIRPYMNKVDIVSFNNICNKKEYPSFNSFWCFERSQRDYAKTFIEENYNPTEDDLIVVVDIDEIFTREGIQYVKKNPPKNFYFIKGSLYFPYFYHKVGNWDCGLVIRYNKNMAALSKYRMRKRSNILKYKLNPSKPLITHCSYCFKELEQYKNKIKSYIHQEYNKPPYITNNWIFKSHYCRLKINSRAGYDEPYEGWKHLLPDDPRLKYLIDPSFSYPLNLTNYTKKDLENLCDRKYRRTPFE